MAVDVAAGVTRTAAVPFEPILEPFVDAGRAQLEREAGEAIEVFSIDAQFTLECALLDFLSRLAVQTLNEELALRGRFPWPAQARSTGAYDRFVAEMLDGGMDGVLRECPVLERLMATWTSGWARSHAQLARRLRDDWPMIREVLSIAPYRSDPHNGGEAVAILALSGGRLLVYKPRSLEMEEAFASLLEWASDLGFSAPFRSIQLVAREGYGWMEHVAPTPCETQAEVEDFYRRAGGLLCLLSFLQATDIHHENLIARGDQPVLVDLETLLHPRREPVDFAAAMLQTGFLPTGDAVDFSALGATEALTTPFPFTQCEGVNTDGMMVSRTVFHVPRRENVPTLHGRPAIAAQHIESIVAGFGEMFALVLRNRGEVLRPFDGLRGRIIARPSNVYGLLLQESLQPRYMRDAALRADLLARLRPSADELLALERMDVPYFSDVRDLAPARAVLERATESDLPSHLELLRRELGKLQGDAT
jgi:type 2 lantibiotic biosynthesis protein LanM